jgi:hypothetical protein
MDSSILNALAGQKGNSDSFFYNTQYTVSFCPLPGSPIQETLPGIYTHFDSFKDIDIKSKGRVSPACAAARCLAAECMDRDPGSFYEPARDLVEKERLSLSLLLFAKGAGQDSLPDGGRGSRPGLTNIAQVIHLQRSITPVIFAIYHRGLWRFLQNNSSPMPA